MMSIHRLTISILFLTFLGISGNCQDQDPIRTRYGALNINIYYQDTLLNLSSSKVLTVLNYETADIYIKLDPSTIASGYDSINDILINGFYDAVEFRGQLGVGYINPEEHFTQKFESNGDLTINGITQNVYMNGSLTHVDQGPDIACMLYLHLDFAIEDFELDELMEGFAPQACVEIIQPILATSSDR